ncbi:putative protein cim [Escherichia coli 3-373-03_S4_C1]|nr:putative protein cim [Escherichia coli 3-373-03_S4_C1]
MIFQLCCARKESEIMMSRNIKMATDAQNWLQARGSHVNESYLGVARPIL